MSNDKSKMPATVWVHRDFCGCLGTFLGYDEELDNVGQEDKREYIPRTPLTDNADALLDVGHILSFELRKIYENYGPLAGIDNVAITKARTAIAAASARQTPGEG